MSKFIITYCAVLGAISLITFIIYGVDKSRARNGEWRIRESVLLWLGIFGGAVGALIGMNIFALALHLGAAIFVCIKFY